jgi:hypothetical protein
LDDLGVRVLLKMLGHRCLEDFDLSLQLDDYSGTGFDARPEGLGDEGGRLERFCSKCGLDLDGTFFDPSLASGSPQDGLDLRTRQLPTEHRGGRDFQELEGLG